MACPAGWHANPVGVVFNHYGRSKIKNKNSKVLYDGDIECHINSVAYEKVKAACYVSINSSLDKLLNSIVGLGKIVC